MIKLHHNPAKHVLSHELEALFQQHIVKGGARVHSVMVSQAARLSGQQQIQSGRERRDE